MKSQTYIQQQTFNKLLNSLGIDPMEIEVIDPKVVTDKETEFMDWYYRLGGNMNFTELQIATGWQNHLRKWNKNLSFKQ